MLALSAPTKRSKPPAAGPAAATRFIIRGPDDVKSLIKGGGGAVVLSLAQTEPTPEFTVQGAKIIMDYLRGVQNFTAGMAALEDAVIPTEDEAVIRPEVAWCSTLLAAGEEVAALWGDGFNGTLMIPSSLVLHVLAGSRNILAVGPSGLVTPMIIPLGEDNTPKGIKDPSCILYLLGDGKKKVPVACIRTTTAAMKDVTVDMKAAAHQQFKEQWTIVAERDYDAQRGWDYVTGHVAHKVSKWWTAGKWASESGLKRMEEYRTKQAA